MDNRYCARIIYFLVSLMNSKSTIGYLRSEIKYRGKYGNMKKVKIERNTYIINITKIEQEK